FDNPQNVEYAKIPYEVNDCEKHREFAQKVARETIVLLRNEGNILPLSKNVKKIAIIGPNADNLDCLLGNYNGTPSQYITPLTGIKNLVSENTNVEYVKGCDLTDDSEEEFKEAVEVAENADIVLLFMGISPKLEGEERRLSGLDDRQKLDLPMIQQRLLRKVFEVNKEIILTICNGSPISLNWASKNVPAIIESWYPGQEGGTAIAKVIFGDYSPAGRLPITIVKSVEDLPPFEDYNMKGRTYRYLEKEALYPFGFGLSYSEFRYRNVIISSEEVQIGESVSISAEIENIGEYDSDEVIQLYIKHLDSEFGVKNHQLIGIKRMFLKKDEIRNTKFKIKPRQMALINNEGKCILEPGRIRLYLGGTQPDKRSSELTGKMPLSFEILVAGNRQEIEY
ncbi:MAG: glycoside hydrolase family 3 protein, partial [Candidatus Lokiarchaeota archaeon]|nr:glycoside hydrolase family 3 protein [Candidatus Lokiarchaeota archaeon]